MFDINSSTAKHLAAQLKHGNAKLTSGSISMQQYYYPHDTGII